jgi:hypothetical protein
MRVPIAIAAVLALFSMAQAMELTAQKSAQQGVTVAVTPQGLGCDAATWGFQGRALTHSQDLNDDLTKTTVLIDPSGTGDDRVANTEGR